MADEVQNPAVSETNVPEEPVAAPDHPHAGVPEEGWSAPACAIGEGKSFAKLVVKRGGAETDVAFSFCPPATIGRFDPGVGPIDVDLGAIPEGTYVSRKHARITCEDGVWKISDLGSSNGTFVMRSDFERVDEAEIQDGAEIALGNARLVFHLEPAAEAIAAVAAE